MSRPELIPHITCNVRAIAELLTARGGQDYSTAELQTAVRELRNAAAMIELQIVVRAEHGGVAA